jgi:serine/threonine-protein kinase HipA
MREVSVLAVLLHDYPIGTLTRVSGDRNIFAFSEAYIDNASRPTLSLSFKDSLGGLITDIPPTQTRVPPFFANMLPEGAMRDFLATRAGVNPKREFFLLWVLGTDLPGAVTIRPADGEDWPPDSGRNSEEEGPDAARALRFSLAGVQLKFSAARDAAGGLTISPEGIGGSWIVKLPSMKHDGVSENEYSMMTLAARIGMDLPELRLVELRSIEGLPEGMHNLKGPALAVKRFDRTPEGPVHIEDFAQVFRVYPEDKYKRASYRNIAEVIAAEAGNDGVAEFVRRLVFNTLIGNTDMHLKNWSLIYPDRRTAALSPAYDFVSTIHYIPDDKAALSYVRTKQMAEFSYDLLANLARKARLPEKLVHDAAAETVARFHEAWRTEKKNLPLSRDLIVTIDDLIVTIEKHVKTVPIAQEVGFRVAPRRTRERAP